MSIDICG
jgi:hypothetical protein